MAEAEMERLQEKGLYSRKPESFEKLTKQGNGVLQTTRANVALLTPQL